MDSFTVEGYVFLKGTESEPLPTTTKIFNQIMD